MRATWRHAHLACAVFALASVPSLAWAHGQGEGTAPKLAAQAGDRSASPIDTRMPPYPPELGWQGIGGKLALVLDIDPQGQVAGARVESSSGHQALDALALQAALAWRFEPARRDGKPVAAQVRVPVTFEIPPQDALDRVTGRPRDAHFLQRRSGAMPLPQRDDDGRLPGYLQDDLPIGVDSVAAGERMLQRHAFREPDAVAGQVREYTLRDEEGFSVWNVVLPGAFPHALVRRRLVGAPEGSWFVSSLLCEGADAGCARLRTHLQASVPAQPLLPPLPELPPLADEQPR